MASKTKRMVQVENKNPSKNLLAIEEYFHGSGYSLEKILNLLQDRQPSNLLIGRGGSHVWIADKCGNRLLIIT